MQLRPEDLDAAGYQLMDRLDHMELVPFVRKYLAERTLFTNMYLVSNLLCFALAAYTLIHYWQLGTFTLGDGITWFSYGLAIAFLLVPLHEFIHVLAYRSQGAQQTSYEVNLRKFYFLAVADRFVATRKEFQLVALAPFVIISCGGLLVYFISDPFWKMAMSGMLLTHTAFCSGDFGLLSYFRFHKDRDIVTFDDRTNKLSYFYGK